MQIFTTKPEHNVIVKESHVLLTDDETIIEFNNDCYIIVDKNGNLVELSQRGGFNHYDIVSNKSGFIFNGFKLKDKLK